jgi:menaquinone-dependent protoporphyrinogen IX oxidase
VKIQIIYYSKYGSTKEIAQAIGRKLKTAVVVDVRELKEIRGDVVVIGSAIYSEVQLMYTIQNKQSVL